MRLVLHYRGPLKANGSTAHKHQLRQCIHRQLSTLWNQLPLSGMTTLREERRDGELCLLRPLEGFTFVPLVAAEMNAVAELTIVLLRPEPPGHLITQGGDIDNRLKTLLDALTMPRHSNALPVGVGAEEDEEPFYCLLEDDNLVIAINVRTEQLLEPLVDANTVEATIHIRTRVTMQTWDNGQFQ